MKHLMSKTLLTISLLFSNFVLADIAVLIHGYHSSGNSWRYNGIVPMLTTTGWNDAGHYDPMLGNIGFPGHTLSNTGKHLVTVELPSESPVEIQADILHGYLNDIAKRFPRQKIHLVAHSAGGIVARLVLVRIIQAQNHPVSNDFIPIVQLITIATPHLGSPMAEFAERASDTPIGFFAPLFGADEINRAEILYSQLGREEKNDFLFRLNRQLHPPIVYRSVIRADGSIMTGDIFVPPQSQNMAWVPAIGSQSELFLTPGDHSLKYADGLLLMSLLP